MDQLFSDLAQNVRAYYDEFIALLPKLGLALFVLITLMFLANLAQNFSQKRLNRRMDDPLLARFIARMVGTSVIVLAILVALNIVGLGGMAVGLLSTAGLSAFIIGFAFKDIGENFLAGVVLAFKRPFRVGDLVELNGQKGRVVTLNLRDTQIKSPDGKDIFIPNANIVKNAVINYTIDGYLREEFTLGLDYVSNIEEAVAVMQQVLERHPAVLQGAKSPQIVYGDLSANKLNVHAQYWIDAFALKLPTFELRKQLVNQTLDALSQHGFYKLQGGMDVKANKNNALNNITPSSKQPNH